MKQQEGMKKYQIIYADPPWKYYVWSEDKKNAQGNAKRYYETMTIEDICNLKVGDIADKDCKLFLWATPPV
jgi:N6-adenosine-specific RNA methylase IME4